MASLRASLIEALHEKDRVMSRPLSKDDYVDAFVDWLYQRADELERDGDARAAEFDHLARELDLIALGQATASQERPPGVAARRSRSG